MKYPYKKFQVRPSSKDERLTEVIITDVLDEKASSGQVLKFTEKELNTFYSTLGRYLYP